MEKGGEPALHPGSPAHLGLMKPIDPHHKRLKPLPDEIPITVVQVIAEIAPRQSGQVAHAIDEKRHIREVMVLGQSAEKCGGWIRSTSVGDTNSKHQFRLNLDRGVQPLLFSSDRYSGFVDGDPRLVCLQRVWGLFSTPR